MTCTIAVRFTTQDQRELVVVGADTEISGSSKRFVGVINLDKAQPIGNGYVLISGGGPILEVLDLINSDPEYSAKVRLDTRVGVREIAEIIFDNYKDLAETSLEELKSMEPGPLIFASPTNIWAVYTDLSVLEYGQFVASGAGEDAAIGALTILYDNLKADEKDGKVVYYEEVEEMVYRAIEASVFNVLGVGKPITMHRVEALPPVKKPTKKK